MELLKLFLLFIPALAYIKEGPIYNLRGKEFEAFLEEFKDNLRSILFYAPSVTTGRAFTSDYFQSGKDLINTDIKLAKIDITDQRNSEIREAYIQYTPPHILYCLAQTSICRNYTGEYSRHALVSSLKTKVVSIHTFHDFDDLDWYLSNTDPYGGIVLGVFPELSGPKYEIFNKFALSYMDFYNFGILKDEGEWSYKFNLTSDSIVIARGKSLHNTIYPYYSSFSGFESEDDVKKFVENAYHPFLSFITPDKLDQIKSESIPFGLFFIDFNRYAKMIPYLVENFVYFSKNYAEDEFSKRKFQWAIADTNDFSNYLYSLGLAGESLFMLIEFRGDYYKISNENIIENDEFKQDCLYNFYRGYDRQTYPKYYKSQPVPKQNYEKGIRVAVGSTLVSLTTDRKVIHGVLLYDPSFQSKSHENLKIIEDLADEYKTNFKIQFLKIDYVHNYVPEGYHPITENKLYFIGVSKKYPSPYIGEFTFEGIKKRIDYLLDLKEDL
jgi:Thioredoxin-like domain